MIKHIVIPTCNRPQALVNLLEALSKNFQMYDRNPSILVADDSDRDEADRNVLDIISELNISRKATVRFLGRQARAELSCHLIQSGISRESVDMCLGSKKSSGLPSIGSTRNLLSLAAGGRAFVSLDDDVELKFVRRCGMNLYSGAKCRHEQELSEHWLVDPPVQYWTYKNREELLADCLLEQSDFLSLHEEQLGKTVGCNDYASSPRTIAVSLNGVAGDCGWGTPSKFFFLSPDSIRRLTSSDNSYREKILSREMVRIVSCSGASTKIEDMMSTSFGVATDVNIPPFFPIGRGSDILFGLMLHRLYPTYMFGQIAQAILHTPFPARRFWPGEIFRSARSTDLSSFVYTIVSQLSDVSCASCESLGNALIGLAQLSHKEFLEFARANRLASSRDKSLKLKLSMEAGRGRSEAFLTDLAIYTQAIEAGDSIIEGWFPSELLLKNDLSGAVVLSRNLLRAFGVLLVEWKSIRQAASEWLPSVGTGK